MPRIRIVDEWLRFPGAPPTRWRSVMVVADVWGEQRVLMRAYAECQDQTRPTIVLHGAELAIGPAGTDSDASWGIHVHPPADGRAQEISDQLVLAARRLAGSKGNAPRLQDEQSSFDRKRTDNWAPGTPRADEAGSSSSRPYYEPMVAASQVAAPAYAGAYDHAAMVAAQSATVIPYQPQADYVSQSGVPIGQPIVAAPAHNPQLRLTPVPMMAAAAQGEPAASESTHRRRRGWTSPIPRQNSEPGGRTALGYESGAGAQSAIVRLGLRPAAASQLGRIADRTVPVDFEITAQEREVLHALADAEYLPSSAIAILLEVEDARPWMDELIAKLAGFGLDLVASGGTYRGEPTYRLVR